MTKYCKFNQVLVNGQGEVAFAEGKCYKIEMECPADPNGNHGSYYKLEGAFSIETQYEGTIFDVVELEDEEEMEGAEANDTL